MEKRSITAQDYLTHRRAELTRSILTLRKECGLTRQDLAGLLHCSVERILAIEQGRDGYTLEELELLSARLGKQPNIFLQPSAANLRDLYNAYSCEVSAGALGERFLAELPEGTSLFPVSERGGVSCRPNIFFSQDGSLFASVLRKKTGKRSRPLICVWELQTGQVVSTIDVEWHPQAVAFSPDNTHIVFSTEHDSASVWSLVTNHQVAVLDPVDDGYPSGLWEAADEQDIGFGEMSHFLWSEDNAYIFSYNERHGLLRVWDPYTWRNTRTFSLPDVAQSALDVELFIEKEKEELLPRPYPVKKFAYIPDEKMLVFSAADYSGLIFELPLESGNQIPPQVNGVSRFTMLQDYALCPIDTGDDLPYSNLLVLAGRDGFVEYLHLRGSEYKHDFRTLSRLETPIPCDTLHLAIVDPECILALTAIHAGESRQADWVLTNLVTHQTVALPDLDREYHNAPECRNFLAPDGRRVVYLKAGRIYLQQIYPEKLVPPHYARHSYQRAVEWHKEHLARRKAKNASDIADLDIEAMITGDDPASEGELVNPTVDPVCLAVQRWKRKNPAPQGGFGLAYLLPQDGSSVQSSVEKIRARTKETVTVVDAAEIAGDATIRNLVSLILGQELESTEFKIDAIWRLEREKPYTMIFVDHAEYLSYEAIMWIFKNQPRVTDLFVLVSRDLDALTRIFVGHNVGFVRWIFSRRVNIDFANEILDV